MLSPHQRLGADLAALVNEANGGDPIWWRDSAWVWGLPTWSLSGRPFRGLAALLLWRAARDCDMSIAWQEAKQDTAGQVSVPVRTKRGWAPLAVAPSPRLAALSFPVPRWNEQPFEETLAALRLHERPTLAPLASKIRELHAAFVQALRRQSASQPPRHSDWTVESLSITAGIAATIADATYAAKIGKLFAGDSVWLRGDVAALFPWETQVPGGLLEAADRGLKQKGARVLVAGMRPGQLPMRRDAVLRLDRVWTRGRVLDGYGRILQAMVALGIEVSGDAAMDARALGLALARRSARVERLPANVVDADGQAAWDLLLARTVRRAWAHRLHVLCVGDVLGDPRWDPERLLPRVQKLFASHAGSATTPQELPLAAVGLLRLLDSMGPRRPDVAPKTEDVLASIGTVSDRSYQRRPIYKSDRTTRWLDVPSSALAQAQRRLVELLRPCGPFAGVATAFEPGRSPALQARFHEGALAAVIIDIADFFGSIRPRHLRWAFHPRPAPQEQRTNALLLTGGTREQRESLLHLLFAGGGRTRWLPQGAPSSPWAANLAAHPMDRSLRAWARDREGVRYSRYADDLVLSMHRPPGTAPPNSATIGCFLDAAEDALRAAVRARGWQVNEAKTRRWRRGDRSPLTLCGVESPSEPGAPCRLPRSEYMRARAILHHLRCGSQEWNHGMLAWAWSATGQPGWLAWGSPELSRFATTLAGAVLSEALLAGWADSVDHEDGAALESTGTWNLVLHQPVCWTSTASAADVQQVPQSGTLSVDFGSDDRIHGPDDQQV